MYSVEGLRHGIERCKINIETLKTAIKTEEATVAQYKVMIQTIEQKEREQDEAKANVHLEVVRDLPQ